MSSLRASDSDREQVADQLSRAATQGRLSTAELEERIGLLYRSRTYGELDALIADLPSTALDRPRRQLPALALPGGALALVLMLGALLTSVRPHLHRGFVGGSGPIGAGDPTRSPGLLVTPPLVRAHHAMMLARPMFGLIVVMALAAAAVWLLAQRRALRDA